MDIKAELRLIRENEPEKWDEIMEENCPKAHNDRLENPCEISEYENGQNICINNACEECWDKAIEEEEK